jgi:hypothetical protein
MIVFSTRKNNGEKKFYFFYQTNSQCSTLLRDDQTGILFFRLWQFIIEDRSQRPVLFFLAHKLLVEMIAGLCNEL